MRLRFATCWVPWCLKSYPRIEFKRGSVAIRVGQRIIGLLFE